MTLQEQVTQKIRELVRHELNLVEFSFFTCDEARAIEAHAETIAKSVVSTIEADLTEPVRTGCDDCLDARRVLEDKLLTAEATRNAAQHESTLNVERRRTFEYTVTSIATMLGWNNVPPRDTLEAEIRALKARAQRATMLEGLLNELVVRLAQARPLSIGSLDSHRDARYSTGELKELIDVVGGRRDSEAA